MELVRTARGRAGESSSISPSASWADFWSFAPNTRRGSSPISRLGAKSWGAGMRCARLGSSTPLWLRGCLLGAGRKGGSFGTLVRRPSRWSLILGIGESRHVGPSLGSRPIRRSALFHRARDVPLFSQSVPPIGTRCSLLQRPHVRLNSRTPESTGANSPPASGCGFPFPATLPVNWRGARWHSAPLPLRGHRRARLAGTDRRPQIGGLPIPGSVWGWPQRRWGEDIVAPPGSGTHSAWERRSHHLRLAQPNVGRLLGRSRPFHGVGRRRFPDWARNRGALVCAVRGRGYLLRCVYTKAF